MTVNYNLPTVSISQNDLENIQEAHEGMEGTQPEKVLEFLPEESFGKLDAVIQRLGELSLNELALLTRKWAEKLQHEYVYPHVTETAEGELVYQHCLNLAAVRSFSPVLALPHSGQGFSTVQEWKIKHPALLKFEVTVGGLDREEEAEEMEGLVGDERLKHLKALAARKVNLEWRAPGSQEWKPYTVGALVPEGSAGYRLEHDSGFTAGAAVNKRQFDFVVTEVPRVLPEDIVLIGKAESATQARVTIIIKGVWCAVSQAEKFAATLSKLCVDAVPEAHCIQDTELGGIVLYAEPEVSMDDFVQKAVDGSLTPVTLPHVGLGQETAKGASTYNPAAATVLALTGKRVLRKTHQVTQPVEVRGELKDFPVGDVVWDSDEFVQFRRKWSKATVRTGVWGRWVDEYMVDILKSAVKYQQMEEKMGTQEWEEYPYRFVKAGETEEDGYYYFHRTEVRIELAPMTMETSTQLENLGSTPTGGMFWELQNTFNVL
jgi:hypothetical protein